MSPCSRLHGQRCKSVHMDDFIWPTVKGSKVKKNETILNRKNNSGIMDRDIKVSSLYDTLLRGQRSKNVSNGKINNINIMDSWTRTDMQKCSHWPRYPTYRWGVREGLCWIMPQNGGDTARPCSDLSPVLVIYVFYFFIKFKCWFMYLP